RWAHAQCDSYRRGSVSRLRLRLGVGVAALTVAAAAGAYPATDATNATDVGAGPRVSSAFVGASKASGDCSKAAARPLTEQYHLNDFSLPNPVLQVLCGPFTGPGSEAMAITIGAPTCWSPQRWAVFSFSGGAWKLVLDQHKFIFPLVAVGSDIRE